MFPASQPPLALQSIFISHFLVVGQIHLAPHCFRCFLRDGGAKLGPAGSQVHFRYLAFSITFGDCLSGPSFSSPSFRNSPRLYTVQHPGSWAGPHLQQPPSLPAGSLGILVIYWHVYLIGCNLTFPTCWGRTVWSACFGSAASASSCPGFH